MSDDDSEVVVRLEDIEVHFTDDSFLGSESVVKAVDGVSLSIYENEIIALVGESGCGKTTLGKTAVGLQRPTGGSVRYRGQDVFEAMDGTGQVDIPYNNIRRSLQIIHQDPGSALNPNRTVLANLSVPLKKYRPDTSPGRREQIVHALLERTGIRPAEDYSGRFPHQLSGGEQQRVALVRALLMSPDLILADEAVSALDVSLRVEMMDLMLELREVFDTSYLFISHDFANARYLTKKADGRIGVMYLGNLVEIGPVDEVIENPKHPYTKALVWATPKMDPRVAEGAIEDEPPVREIDIPDPEDPPSGCTFHTRCPKIIPPEGMDITQEAYNEIVDFRLSVQDQSLDTYSAWREVGVDPRDLSEGDRAERADEFVAALRDQEFDVDLASPHRERIDDAMAQVATEKWDDAAADLREHYESVCERVEPEPRGSHPVACHLYEDESTPTVESDESGGTRSEAD